MRDVEGRQPRREAQALGREGRHGRRSGMSGLLAESAGMIDKLPGRGMHMANEAQALAGESPGESLDDGEYKAFLSVLASSARGRAFLAEHARRARQADTEMQLAAQARNEDKQDEQREQAAAPGGSGG